MRVPAKLSMSRLGRKDPEDAREPSKEDATEVGPVVTEALVAPLGEVLRELVAEGLPPDAVEEALGQLLARLRVGVEQLRPTKQLAPWMAEVVGKVAGGTTLENSEDQIADALLPFLDLLPPELAEVLRITDHGALTQREATARFGISLVALKSRVHAARRRLRVVVLAGLKVMAPDTTDTSKQPEPSPDTRPRRRRVQPCALFPAFTAAVEALIRVWVPAGHVPAAAQALLTRLRAALSTRRRQTRLGPWLHAILYATLVSGPWSSTLLAPPSLTPTPADLAALSTALAPLLATLTPEQSGAILLFDLSMHSLHATAGEAGTDRPTFQNRLQRARIRLTRTLTDLSRVKSPTSTLAA
ncbi:MAG: hypothetical protein IPG17_30400 [Sandaracinaceae bacterium]|nr:hypothetical protein [Sandaracinaceae bacterium]